ncbi:hypothetical protein AbraIFM66950_006891 [Aspergillus brasiliensis]|nr:hypothetical protein AbraIFM66950_006891 [Aspergillus brasiliensis]
MATPHSRYNLRKRNAVGNDIFDDLDKLLREQRKIPRAKKSQKGKEKVSEAPPTEPPAEEPQEGTEKASQSSPTPPRAEQLRESKEKASQAPSTTAFFTTDIHVSFIADVQEADQKVRSSSAGSPAPPSDWYRSSHGGVDLDPKEAISTKHFYYQRTGRPKPSCLIVANVELDDEVMVDRIVDPQYLPSDDDTEFQNLVDLWQDPAVEDADMFADSSELEKLVDPKKIKFTRFFRDIHDDKYRGDIKPDPLFEYMASLFDPPVSGEIGFRRNCYFPFAREDLGMHQGRFYQYYIGKGITKTPGGQMTGIPLAVCTVRFLPLVASRYLKLNNQQCKPHIDKTGIAWSEIPGLLLQANMAFEFDCSFEQYPAYVISVREWGIHFVKGTMMRQEVACLRDKDKLSGRIEVQRTRAYNLHDRGERKEVIRVMLGLLRSFKDRPEANFSTALPCDSPVTYEE